MRPKGDLCAAEETEEKSKEMCEMMYEAICLLSKQSYSMTTTTTHTEVIAAMAEETQDDGDEMDPMAMLMNSFHSLNVQEHSLLQTLLMVSKCSMLPWKEWTMDSMLRPEDRIVYVSDADDNGSTISFE